MFFTGLSWVSIVIATIVAFFAGWLYYSPWLFGKMYGKEMGWSEGDTEGGPKFGTVKSFGLVLIGEFIMSVVAASLVHSLFITAFSQVFILVLSVWVAFVVATKMNDVLFGGRSWKYFAITVGQDLLSILVIFIIVSLFNR